MKNRLKIIIYSIILITITNGSISYAQTDNSSVLWYDKSAGNFNEALPLGNGRIGMMVYGDVFNEKINLNESSLWGGGPTCTEAPENSVENLQKVRELLFQEKWTEASSVLRNIQGKNSQSFVPMGDLFIDLQYKSNSEPKNYVRQLDLNTALAKITFAIDTINFEREYFVSAPDQVAVIKLKSSVDKQLNFKVSGNTPFNFASIRAVDNDEFLVSGQVPIEVNSSPRYPLVYQNEMGQKGMRYQYRVKIILKDGTISSNPFLKVENATEAIIILSAATSYNGFDKRADTEGKDENAIAENYLRKAIEKSFEELKHNHIADYQSFYNRVSLKINTISQSIKPTNIRLKEYSNGAEDYDLETLYFNFGRYLMISASRPGGIPVNLQGLWNHNTRPSWGSNYTVNINLQMNYWPAEMLNMSELTDPLISQIKNMSVTGAQIAKNYYNMRGWTSHHNSDIWAHVNPVGHQVGDPKWANWSLGSPWLSQHLFEHYRFTGDKDFLANTAYPIMKSAGDFCLDWLVEKDGYLITAPSTSPENVFIDDAGNKGVVTIASAMDLEIIWDLLTNLIEASEVLKTDAAERQIWKNTKSKLLPLRIGKDGNLIEWYKDWKDEDPQHRHVSHLFGLHPGRQISPITTPDLAKASKKTLDIRGDGGTGWSKAWKINFQARLLDGEHAYKMYRELLSKSTLPNLFDTHPPFQIDGNFGGISGVGEMLLQSHLDEIHLLPAIPQSWKSGEINGMKAREAFQVDIKWEKSKLKSAVIKSEQGNPCKIRTDVPVKIKGASAKLKKEGIYYVTTFKTKKNETYIIERK
ncbi:MAG: glycoside hydrolase family 95 protein [Porphyromonadaceae bacterium]|nr:glycoside hydrolase family 95 protein [Porphyromonadaceae bacterium]